MLKVLKIVSSTKFNFTKLKSVFEATERLQMTLIFWNRGRAKKGSVIDDVQKIDIVLQNEAFFC